jgi:hypothetical protein
MLCILCVDFVDENFGDVSSVNVNGDDHGIGMWERS